MFFGYHMATAQSVNNRLTWSPPALENPTTIQLGDGKTQNTLDNTKDYIIKLPSSKKTGSTTLIGGRNIVLIGGYITIPYTDRSITTDMDRRAIYIKDNVGTVHIEGVLIDGSGDGEMDGIAINAPQSTVQLQNLRITGVQGTDSTMHADVVQPWGGVKELRIDRLTGQSGYQGFFIPIDQNTIGKAVVKNVNLIATGQAYGGGGGGYMISITKLNCIAYPITFENTYVQPRSGRPLSKSVWPDFNTESTKNCPVQVSNGVGTWPALPVTGAIREGAPPGGDYVPFGVAGLSYTSPGYGVDPPAAAPPFNSPTSPTQPPTESSPGPLNPAPPATESDINKVDESIGTIGDANDSRTSGLLSKSVKEKLKTPVVMGASLIVAGVIIFLCRGIISHRIVLHIHNPLKRFWS
jgi:hypothetical protein